MLGGQCPLTRGTGRVYAAVANALAAISLHVRDGKAEKKRSRHSRPTLGKQRLHFKMSTGAT